MSRSNFQFIDTDTDTIVARMISNFESVTGRTVQPASYEMLMIRWAASAIVQERVNINYAANQNIPSRAEGENLDALGEIFFAGERPQATAASTTIRFNISEAQPTPWLIPVGTRVATTDRKVYFSTIEDVYVAPGELFADAKAICDTVGIIGNGYVAGQISDLVDIFPLYVSCTNITTSDGGSDIANDDKFYELLRLSEDAYSCAGAAGSYVYYAKSTSTEIADVVVTNPVPGEVDIYALMNDGTIASEEIKDAILRRCNADTVRPLTDHVFARDPAIVAYDIEITYYLAAPPVQQTADQDTAQSAADIRAAVDEAVKQYVIWQSAKIGRDINPSRLISMLMAVGIKRVDLVSPVFTPLKDGTDYDVPEVARVGAITVTSGGYEDE